MKETFIIVVYKLLDYLKAKSPFWWFVIQGSIWISMGLIYKDIIPIHEYKEVLLGFLMSFSGTVGSRTSKKLSESKIKVDPDKFREKVEGFNKQIDKVKDSFIKEKEELIIVKNFLPKGQYVDEITKKTSIILHHTAGGSAQSSIDWWLTKPERVATHFLIERDGTIIQTIPLECWAFALNVGTKENKIPRQFRNKDKELNQGAIQIELCSWGALTKKRDKFYNWAGKEFKEEVDSPEYTFRSYEYFEKYTQEQLRSLKKLIEQLSKDYQISIAPLTFDINIDALSGKSGLYTHVNYNSTKSDCYPNKDLINLVNEVRDAQLNIKI